MRIIRGQSKGEQQERERGVGSSNCPLNTLVKCRATYRGCVSASQLQQNGISLTPSTPSSLFGIFRRILFTSRVATTKTNWKCAAATAIATATATTTAAATPTIIAAATAAKRWQLWPNNSGSCILFAFVLLPHTLLSNLLSYSYAALSTCHATPTVGE